MRSRPLSNSSNARAVLDGLVSPLVLSGKHLLCCMPRSEIRAIHTCLSRLAARHADGHVRFASVCTGSGLGEAVIAQLLETVNEAMLTTGVDKLYLRCCFYVEFNPGKDIWIRKTSLIGAETRSFARAESMKLDRVFCRIVGDLVDVETADILEIVYSCKDLSELNENKDGMLKRIKEYLASLSPSNIMDPPEWLEPVGSTMPSLLGSLQYIWKHRPPLVLLENVKASKQIYTELKSLLSHLGYILSELTIDSAKHFIPQSRVRVYVICPNS